MKAWYLDYIGVFVLEIGEGVVWDFSGLLFDGSFIVDYEEFLSLLFFEANIMEFLFVILLGGFGI